MDELMDDRKLAEQIAAAVQNKFVALPKTGKPQAHEHTVLAGIVAYRPADSHPVTHGQAATGTNYCTHVIALGTGTKCLGGSKRSAAGDLLNDSHAEVITRRAFQAWVLQQLQLAAAPQQPQQQAALQGCSTTAATAQQQQQQQQQGTMAHQLQPVEQLSNQEPQQQSAFCWCRESNRFHLRPNISFALYVSQPPCGDASIFGVAGAEARTAPGRLGSEAPQAPAGRTGAKLLRTTGVADVAGAQLLLATATAGATDGAQQQSGWASTAGLSSQACQANEVPAVALQQPSSSDQLAVVATATACSLSHTGSSSRQKDHAAHGSSTQQLLPASQQQQLEAEEGCHELVHKQHLLQLVPTAGDVEVGPQQLGVLRRKPGKGDPTLSLSCSDKISRWACLGLQGSLLTGVLQEPLYLSMLVVSVPQQEAGFQQQPQQGMQVQDLAVPQQQQEAAEQLQQPHDAAAVLAAAEAAGRRAFGERLAGCAALLQPPFRVVHPKVVAVMRAPPGLGLQPGGLRKVPSGAAVNWNCQMPVLAALQQGLAGGSASRKAAAGGQHEVTSGGRRLGASSKEASHKARSRLSSAAFSEQFKALHKLVRYGQQDEQFINRRYEETWNVLRAGTTLFQGWIPKPRPVWKLDRIV